MAEERKERVDDVGKDRDVSSGVGTLRLLPEGPVVAGSFGTWTFEFIGNVDLSVCDTLEIVFFTRFSTNLWSLPQLHDPTAPGFVTARRSDGGFVHVAIERIPTIWHPHGVTLHVIRATIGGTALPAGSSLAVVYGDPSGGSPGVQAQFLAREVVFPVFLGTKAPPGQTNQRTMTLAEAIRSIKKPTLAEVSGAATFTPSLQVIGGRASSFHVVLPSLARGETKVPVRVTALDMHGNRAEGFQGTASLFIEQPDRKEVPQAGSLQLREGRGTGELTLTSSGPRRVVALDSHNRITGTAAPTLVTESEPEKRIFWGEIHVHTVLSDALGRAEEHFECAVNDAGLDFGAITDHDSSLHRNPRAWDTVVEKTEEYHQPGRFVTLLGYEVWAMVKGRYSSHANVYFPGSTAPLLFRPDIQDLRRFCEQEGAIVIPHHTQYGWPNMGTNWKDWADFPPEQMPVVEIFSTHGLSEYFGCPRSVRWPVEGRSVQDGLARGYRFGLIAGSDYHECLLGHGMDIEKYPRTINNRHMQTHTGLVAVYATELTREAIFEAIRTRNVYATSGPKMVLAFSINGRPMGREVKIADAKTPRVIAAEAHGTRPLRRIEIVRNGSVIHTKETAKADLEFSYEDRSDIETGTYYYIRVTQSDGEQAWSSPVWVDFQV